MPIGRSPARFADARAIRSLYRIQALLMLRRILIAGFFLVLVPLAAHADIVPQALDQVTGAFRDKTAGWEAGLQTVAVRLFLEMATVEFAWAMGRLSLQRASFDEWLAALVNEILFLGMFLWLLTSMGTIGPAIINSMRGAAQAASGVATITPSDIFAAGVNICVMVMNKVSIFSPNTSAGLIIAGLAIEVCYALIVACMILALVEGYFIVAAGVLFMAFGATRWTSDIAISVLRATLSIGAKLFTVQLIASIGTQFMMDWTRQFDTMTTTQLIIIFGTSLVMLVITKLVPETIQRMIGGSSLAHGGALIGAGAGAVATLAGVGIGAAALSTAAAGAGATLKEAGGLASEQMSAQIAAGGGPTTRLGRAATLAGSTIRNVASAHSTDIGRRLSGSGTTHGMAAWRQAADLKNRRRMLGEEQGRPTPPSP